MVSNSMRCVAIKTLDGKRCTRKYTKKCIFSGFEYCYCSQHFSLKTHDFALIIQKVYRGFKIRNKVRLFNNIPTEIQKRIIKFDNNIFNYNLSVIKLIFRRMSNLNKQIFINSVYALPVNKKFICCVFDFTYNKYNHFSTDEYYELLEIVDVNAENYNALEIKNVEDVITEIIKYHHDIIELSDLYYKYFGYGEIINSQEFKDYFEKNNCHFSTKNVKTPFEDLSIVINTFAALMSIIKILTHPNRYNNDKETVYDIYFKNIYGVIEYKIILDELHNSWHEIHLVL